MLRSIVFAGLVAASPALAQTYPFEGRWRQGANTCDTGLVLTATTMRYLAAGGGCRLTGVTRQTSTTFGYTAQCKDGTGAYATSGTIEMSGPNRFRLRDKLMGGQVDTFDRC